MAGGDVVNNQGGEGLKAPESHAWLAAIIESTDDAIISKTLDGIITTWNPAAQRILGYRSDEAIGRSITMILPPERLQEEVTILSRLRRGERIDHFETVRVTKDGRRLDVSITSSPIRDSTGRIVGASKILRDITRQKQYERDLEDARAAAEESSRVKEQFLAALSHELRTPLTPVLATVDAMERDAIHLAPDVRADLGIIRRNVELEARLIDDLLDLTRIRRGKIDPRFEDVDAHEILRLSLSNYRTEIDEKRLRLTISAGANRHHVRADPARLQQIFSNLISNAVKFSEAGGPLIARTRNDTAGRLVVEVEDRGIGIAPDALTRIFNAFEQAAQRQVQRADAPNKAPPLDTPAAHMRQFGGLGLGLTISKSLAELHGGTLTAASEGLGRGAVVTMTIDTIAPEALTGAADPVAATASSEASAADVHVAPAPAGGRRILLVEDHRDTLLVLSRLLRSFGYEVLAAGSVHDALALIDSEPFDVLISDLGLPDGSGLDIARRTRQRHGVNAHAIALSGFGFEEDLRKSREAGFEVHLTKPVDLSTLKSVLDKLQATTPNC